MGGNMVALREKAKLVYSALFDGRIARTTFAIRAAVFTVTIFFLTVPYNTILATSSKTLRDAYSFLSLGMMALCLLGFVSGYVKRLHDIGLRGYWALPALVGIPAVTGWALSTYASHRWRQDNSFNTADVTDMVFWIALGLPLLLALWRGQTGANRFGPVPTAVEHFSDSKFNIAAVVGAAAILIPTCIYVGIFQSGVWVGRGLRASSMPLIDSMSGDRLFAKCWNIKGVGAGTGNGDMSGVYRDGYGEAVLDFVVQQNGEIDVIPAGAPISKAYRADGFEVYSFGLIDSNGEISIREQSHFMIAAIYDGSQLPNGNINFTTFSFAKTGEIWPEWQVVMASGLSEGERRMPFADWPAQGRGRLMIGDCVVR